MFLHKVCRAAVCNLLPPVVHAPTVPARRIALQRLERTASLALRRKRTAHTPRQERGLVRGQAEALAGSEAQRLGWGVAA